MTYIDLLRSSDYRLPKFYVFFELSQGNCVIFWFPTLPLRFSFRFISHNFCRPLSSKNNHTTINQINYFWLLNAHHNDDSFSDSPLAAAVKNHLVALSRLIVKVRTEVNLCCRANCLETRREPQTTKKTKRKKLEKNARVFFWGIKGKR